jgi:hypothetical protein
MCSWGIPSYTEHTEGIAEIAIWGEGNCILWIGMSMEIAPEICRGWRSLTCEEKKVACCLEDSSERGLEEVWG